MFRASLLAAYDGQCAVTDTRTEAGLEAAHLRPYRVPASNVVTNGLLLRADIHTRCSILRCSRSTRFLQGCPLEDSG
ncbi:HNH endonuclease [Nocardioides pantholopis]|uniref:HNH endonuclease n=1 Tax=Nocardioides pantholopis TaxID=2483798 RepID=UPI0037C503F8